MLNRIFLYASGTDLDLLAKCPTAIGNRVGLGTMVLFTTAISTTAFSLHMQQVFHCSWLAIAPFVVLWGAGIFSLDRWLVGTMRVGNSVKDALAACWMRIVLALLFGAFASDAIVLKTFEPEIENRLMEKRMAARQAAQERIGQRPLYQQADRKQQEIEALQAEVKTLKSNRDKAERDMIDEIQGTSGTGKVGKGPAYEEKRAALNSAEGQYKSGKSEADSRIATLRKEIGQIDTQKQGELDALDRANRDSGGHAARLQALGELMRSNFPVAWGASLAWMLLMAIDCLPILVKIGQAGRGNHPYDTLRDHQEAAEIVVGTVVFQSTGQNRADLETDRLKNEREMAQRVNQKIAQDIEDTTNDAVKTIFLPAARAQITNQIQQHVKQMGKFP